MANLENKEKGRNIACFFFFGVLSLIYDEICLIVAEDILAGSTIATTTVILSIAVPVLVVKLTLPWFLQSVSYWKKISLVILFFIGGLITLVFSLRIPGRLMGVSIVESGVAASEITLLSLTAFYEHITVSAFVAEVGVSSFVGPLYYTSKYVCYSRSLMLRQRLHERGFKSSRFHTLETASKTIRFQSAYSVPISPFSSTYLRYADLVPRKGIWAQLLRRHFVSVNMAKNSAQFTWTDDEVDLLLKV